MMPSTGTWLFIVDGKLSEMPPRVVFSPSLTMIQSSNTTHRGTLEGVAEIRTGDIAYIVSWQTDRFLGWALVREPAARSFEGQGFSLHIDIEIFGLAPTGISCRDIFKRLELKETDSAITGVMPIQPLMALKLDAYLGAAGIPIPGESPEVLELRTQVIGPLASVLGQWALVSDLIRLGPPDGSHLSADVRQTLAGACRYCRWRVVEGYGVVDTRAVLESIMASAMIPSLGSRSAPVLPNGEWRAFDPANAAASPEVTVMLSEAARLLLDTIGGQESPFEPQIEMRHLWAALYLSPAARRAMADAQLAGDASAPFRDDVASFKAFVERGWKPGEDRTPWEKLFARFEHFDVPARPPELMLYHTDYAADAPGRLDTDALNVAADARAFAELICLKDAPPPLAIGLFGDWGFGKSTFMQMIEEAISELTRRAEAEPKLPFVKRIAHIRFNAWHYMDSNLWASLVTHILEELHRHGRGETQERNLFSELQMNNMMQKLVSVGNAEKEAQIALTEIAGKIEAAKTEFATLERQREDTRAKLVADYFEATLDKIVVVDSTVNASYKAMGLGQGPQTARDLHDTVVEARTLAGRIKMLATTLTMGTDKGLGWLLLGVLVFLSVGGSAAFIASLQPGLDKIATSIGTVFGGLAGLAAWLGPLLKKINGYLGPLLTEHTRVMAEYRRRQEEQARLKLEAQTKLEGLSLRQIDLQRRLEEMGTERSRLETMARGERPTELFYKFIEDRLEAGDYRRRLGLVSLVRADFEKISALMKAQRERRENQRPEPVDTNLPDIDRIVLYIDDLDRCKERQVLQVLEAVHLLLALDLFVVIVGVDARWLHLSLEHAYPHHLLGSADAGPESRSRAASPTDYLEKIFQVPYWLRPLRFEANGSFGGLVDRLVGPVQRSAQGGANAGGATLQGTGPVSPLQGNAPAPLIRRLKLKENQEQPEETLSRITLDEKEVTLIKELGPIIGKSPRAVKRFMNIYRLVRSRRKGSDLEAFLSRAAGNAPLYPTTMLVLGLEVGTPADVVAAFMASIKSLKAADQVVVSGMDLGEWSERVNGALASVSTAIGRPLQASDFDTVLFDVARYAFRRLL